MAIKPKEIDFFEYGRKFDYTHAKIMASKNILLHNKNLIEKYMEECMAGVYGKKLAVSSASEQLEKLKIIAELIGNKKFDDLVASDFTKIIIAIDRDPKKGGWVKKKVVTHARKFMRWLRINYWYPEGYPDKDRLDNAKVFLIQNFQEGKYPLEVAGLKVETPPDTIEDRDKLAFEEIEKAWDKIHSVATHSRDKALIGMLKEKGNRIGGLGSLLGEDVVETEFGYLAKIRDKNRDKVIGEPHFKKSAADINTWIRDRRNLLMSRGTPLEDHGLLPFWLNLRSETIEPITHSIWRKTINRLKDKYNKKHPDDKITKRLFAHLARYFNEVQDQLDGVPDNVRRKERAWSPKSLMPSKYGSKISSDAVKKWHEKKLNLDKKKKKTDPIVCWRCNKVNLAGARFCYNCGQVLDDKTAVELEAARVGLSRIQEIGFNEGLLSPDGIQELMRKDEVKAIMREVMTEEIRDEARKIFREGNLQISASVNQPKKRE